MKKRYIGTKLILTMMVMMLCGCKQNAIEDQAVIKIYEAKTDGSGLTSFDYELQSDAIDEQLAEVIEALQKKSDKLVYKTAIGETYELLSYDINIDQLSLNFSFPYLTQDGVTEVLNRAAIVRTIGQLGGVKGISFFVEGEALNDSNSNPIGIMTPEQFIINAGKEINAYEQAELKLYFANASGKGLTEVKRSVVYSSNISLDKLIVDELIKGPGENENGYKTINPNTKVISTTVTDGICYVNLDSSFVMQSDSAVSPNVTIYSIVNSLVELTNINKVAISVDGDSSIIYREVMPLSTVYERNLEIVD